MLLSLSGCGSESDRVLEETFERLYPIQPTADIHVQNRDGAVFVYGSNTNEMQVSATIKAYSRTPLKQNAVDVSVQPPSPSTRTPFPPHPSSPFFSPSPP